MTTWLPGHNLHPEANGVAAANAMDYSSGAVTGHLSTHSASLPFNDGQQERLFPDNRGISSSLVNFDYRGPRDQENCFIQPCGN